MKKFPLLFASALTLLSVTACGASKNNKEVKMEESPISLKETQLSFEENYIKDTYSYSTGGKFAVSMLANIGTICAGVGFDSPTTVVSGVFGLIGTVGDNFCGSTGPTIKDVMNKLGEMDTKLDAINAKIDQNYNQLLSEEIRTQAMVDKVLLEDQEAAISAFYTDYTMPLENHVRDYTDYMEQSLKKFVSTPETVTYTVHKENNGWALNSLTDPNAKIECEIKVEIKDFSYSLAFLEKHNNTVESGFMDALYGDLIGAVRGTTMPTGLTASDCRDLTIANILETYSKEYYTADHNRVLDLRNKAINYSKAISGRSIKSVLDRYIARMKYMYNFASEIKGTVTDLFSNIMGTLKTDVALASGACAYGETNQEELRTEFLNARNAIQNYYNNVMNLKDNYCFLTNTCMEGGLYRSKFDTYYTNKGNDCRFNANLKLEKVVSYPWCPDNFEADNFNNHNTVVQADHLRIVTRWHLMKELGLTNSKTYIGYLVEAKALTTYASIYYDIYRYNGYFTDDAFKFMTNLTTRDMNDGDKNFKMTCNEAGNPGGDYFNVGWTGTFRGGHTASCWSGKIAETTYIDASTGTTMADKKVAAYATYNESHWNWIDDEHWSFVDNTSFNYFFILDNVAA